MYRSLRHRYTLAEARAAIAAAAAQGRVLFDLWGPGRCWHGASLSYPPGDDARQAIAQAVALFEAA